MNKKHEKSACCRAVIIKFGNRRRQCKKCDRTWSLWKKKRGRKRIRIINIEAERFIWHKSLPIRKHLRSRSKEGYRLTKSRKWSAKVLPWPVIPNHTRFIAVADALVKFLSGKWYAWYFIFLRPIKNNEALILPFFYQQGTETAGGWNRAFDTIPDSVRSRIVALTCDGHTGLVSEARWRNWKLQRCHFHLIARLQSRRSRWRKGRHKEEAGRIYERVKVVLESQNIAEVAKAVNELEEIGWTSTSPEVRTILNGLTTNYADYRTYLKYPNLYLPTTNNTAETFVGLVEELSRRGRGFKTIKAFNEWITVLIKTRKKIFCRPKERKKYQQN